MSAAAGAEEGAGGCSGQGQGWGRAARHRFGAGHRLGAGHLSCFQKQRAPTALGGWDAARGELESLAFRCLGKVQAFLLQPSSSSPPTADPRVAASSRGFRDFSE